MATASKKSGTAGKASNSTSRGLKQDRALVAATQKHEVAYEAKKTGSTAGAVKEAVKTTGHSRKKVEVELSKLKRKT